MGRRKGRITVRGNSLIADFYYQSERFRVAIPGLSASSKAHRQTADDLLLQIQADISRNAFNLSGYFPDHPKALQFRKGCDIKIEDRLNQWLERARQDCAASTWRDYKSAVNYHLIPEFGSFYMSDLTLGMIREWAYSLDISKKRIKNVLIPLKAIFDEAVDDEILDRSPFDTKSLLRKLNSPPPEVAPFTKEEMKAILLACDGQIRNIFQFAFWTGLRTSELIALQWSDIDLNHRSAHIWHVRTRAEEKEQTKTSSGKRKIELLQPAIDALKSQKQHTSEGHIFLNPRTGEPWKHDGPLRKTAWKPTLELAGVPYRKAYATRHTYASLMLSAGKQPMWVAQQMGHKDWGMIRKTYGRWIPNTSSSHDDISHLWAHDGHKENVSD